MITERSSKDRFVVGLLLGVIGGMVLGLFFGTGRRSDDNLQVRNDITVFSLHRFELTGEWKYFMGRINSLNSQSEEFIYVPIYDYQYPVMANPSGGIYLFTVLSVRKELSAQERFEEVAGWLGKNFFDGDMIVPRPRDRQEAVLTCDLKAKGKSRNKAYADMGLDDWYIRFQGSSGGAVTEGNLFCNLLQPGLEAEWLDSVRLVHTEGDEHDHVPRINHIVTRQEVLEMLVADLK